MGKECLISLLLVCFFSCNQKQSPQQSNDGGNVIINPPAAKDTNLISSWYVKGCAEKAAKGDTKFPSSGVYNDYPELSLSGQNGIKAEGDSIVYSRNVDHLCCRLVNVSTERRDNIITVTEYWYHQGCKCKCSSNVRAVIHKLPKGNYQVYGIETGTSAFDDKPTEGRDTVMNQIVTIK